MYLTFVYATPVHKGCTGVICIKISGFKTVVLEALHSKDATAI